MLEQRQHPSELHDSPAMSALEGLLSGGVGTVAMTAAMAGMHRRLPLWQQYALPPRMIVEDAAEEADLDDDLSSDDKEALAWLSHFGYGSLLGMAYGLLARKPFWRGVGGGMAFGLAAWGGGYLGWLPALNMRASATKEPAERIAMMIAAHLVWGGATGLVQEMQQSEDRLNALSRSERRR